MLERLSSPPDVLAMRVSGTVTEADVALSIVWMDEAMAANPTLHVFAEVDELNGVDPSGLVYGWRNGVHFLTHLQRFGRVAIVSEDRWVRALARLESAVLPGISYRVVGRDEREKTFAWVCGEARALGH